MTCQNQAHQEVCRRFHGSVPCCEEIYKTYFSSFPPAGARDEVCIVEVFDLAKAAAENNLIRFRSQGICMYPYLKPGDILQIEPKTAQEIKIGDIVVFKRSGYLYAHRAIEKGRCANTPYIVTRSDRVKDGDDGPSFDADILGVVSDVKRKSNIAHLEKEGSVCSRSLFLESYFKWYFFKKKLFDKIVHVILYIQQNRIYRKIAAFLFLTFHKKIDISVRVPLNFKITSRFYQDIAREDLKLLALEAQENDALARWSIVAYMKSRFMGIISFVHKPKYCPFSGWWISESGIRIRYRGMGIEELLFKESDAVFNELGVRETFVCFFKMKKLNRIAFRNSGFIETSIYDNKFHNNVEKNKTEIPLIMRRLTA